MPGISIHVVDVSRGVVATGMRVEIFHGDSLVTAGQLSAKGLLEDEALGRRFQPGFYEARFHVSAWYRAQGIACPFLDVVSYRFGVADPEQHYHLPFKCTPWGYSCFRGGA